MIVSAFRPGPARELETLPSGVTLFVREELSEGEVRRLAGYLGTRPESTLRVTGDGVRLLDRLRETLPRHVELDSRTPPVDTFSFERVVSVRFAGARVAGWMRRFPNARAVRITLHGERIDASAVATERLQTLSLAEGAVSNIGALARSSELATLELRDVALDDFEPVGSLSTLQSLRLSAIQRLSSIDALRGHSGLRALWLQRLPFLDSLDVLGTLPALESLELSKLWQFELRHTGVLSAMPAMRRVSVDIGGRRKNVEVEKRLALPPAYRFDATPFTKP